MHIRFGNMSIDEFEAAVATEFTAEEKRTLESLRTNTAQFSEDDRFHIFDDPAVVVVSGWDALDVIRPIMEAADARSPFQREVTFYPNKAKK